MNINYINFLLNKAVIYYAKQPIRFSIKSSPKSVSLKPFFGILYSASQIRKLPFITVFIFFFSLGYAT